MQRILVARWMFLLAIVVFVVSWFFASVNGWMAGFNTINGYDPCPVLFLIPLGILLIGYGVGGPLARRGWISGLTVERWLYVAGIGSYVGGYAAGALSGWQFNATNGGGTDSFPSSLFLSIVLLGFAAAIGDEPAPAEPARILGPGGVPRDGPDEPLPRPDSSRSWTEARPRRLDRFIVVGAVVALAIIFVFWTGYDPAIYGPNALHWTLVDHECGPGGNSTFLPDFEHRFPLWARVHVVWSSNVEGDVYTYGPMGPYYDGLGFSGNWSFVSNAQPVVFVVTPIPLSACENLTAQFAATVIV